MSRYFKTHERWASTSPRVSALKLKQAFIKPVEDNSVEHIKEDEVVTEPIVVVEKKAFDTGSTEYIIHTNCDHDEIRYNIGSRKVTAKNRSKCSLYEGPFTLEEDVMINASVFKGDELICSTQG